MKCSHVFLDFDETLFNHYAYFDWLDQTFNNGVTKNGFNESSGKFHKSKGENLRLYNHSGHIRAITGKSWEIMSGEIEKLLEAGSEDFCYDDSHNFLTEISKLDIDVRILTYGNAEYQRFKINSCPLLRKLHLPVHAVNRAKREFLSEHMKSANGVLIDDKHPLSLPSNWQHMWLDRDRSAKEPEYLDKGVIRINSLGQALEFFK